MRALPFASLEALVGAACVTPSFLCNVLPHAMRIAPRGSADEREIIATVVQAAGVVFMALAPVAALRVKSLGLKGLFVIVALAALAVNFLNALDAITTLRSTALDRTRTLMAQAGRLNGQFLRLQRERDGLPAHRVTSEAAALAANESLAELEKTKDAECGAPRGGRGERCRRLEEEIGRAQEDRQKLLAERALTVRAEQLEEDISRLGRELSELGPVPVHSDETAAKVVRLLNLFMPVDSATELAIGEWRTVLAAAFVEAMGLVGPLMAAAVFGKGGRAGSPLPHVDKTRPVSKVPASPQLRSVLAFLPTLQFDDKGRISAKAAYEAYISWVEAQNESGETVPCVSKTVFGTGLLTYGLVRIKSNGQIYYERPALGMSGHTRRRKAHRLLPRP